MLIHTALALNDFLPENSKIGAKIVFFDGEEAFVSWSGTDNTYGSRHLAAEWEEAGFLPKIDLFVLLDLIGARDLKLKSTHRETDYAFDRLASVEQRLSKNGLFVLSPSSPHSFIFN